MTASSAREWIRAEWDSHPSFSDLDFLCDTLLFHCVGFRVALINGDKPPTYENVFRVMALGFPYTTATYALAIQSFRADPRHDRLITDCVVQHVAARRAALKGRETAVSESQEIRAYLDTSFAVLDFLSGGDSSSVFTIPDDWTDKSTFRARLLAYRAFCLFLLDQLFFRVEPGKPLPKIQRRQLRQSYFLLLNCEQLHELGVSFTEDDPAKFPLTARELYSLKSTTDGLFHDLMNFFDYRSTLNAPLGPAEEISAIGAFASDMNELIDAGAVASYCPIPTHSFIAGHRSGFSKLTLGVELLEVIRCVRCLTPGLGIRLNAIATELRIPSRYYGDPLESFVTVFRHHSAQLGIQSIEPIHMEERGGQRRATSCGIRLEVEYESEEGVTNGSDTSSFADLVIKLLAWCDEETRQPMNETELQGDHDAVDVGHLCLSLGFLPLENAASFTTLEAPHLVTLCHVMLPRIDVTAMNFDTVDVLDDSSLKHAMPVGMVDALLSIVETSGIDTPTDDVWRALLHIAVWSALIRICPPVVPGDQLAGDVRCSATRAMHVLHNNVISHCIALLSKWTSWARNVRPNKEIASRQCYDRYAVARRHFPESSILVLLIVLLDACRSQSTCTHFLCTPLLSDISSRLSVFMKCLEKVRYLLDLHYKEDDECSPFLAGEQSFRERYEASTLSRRNGPTTPVHSDGPVETSFFGLDTPTSTIHDELLSSDNGSPPPTVARAASVRTAIASRGSDLERAVLYRAATGDVAAQGYRLVSRMARLCYQNL